jgi:hypothetical protein
MNELVRYEEDDGFDSSLRSSDRLLRGTHARWTDAKGWHDRDGLPIPSPLLVVSVLTALQRWQNKVPEVITAKPLPNPDELNAAIPQSEWEIGLDGKPRPPWVTVLAVYMIDLRNGQLFTRTRIDPSLRLSPDPDRASRLCAALGTGERLSRRARTAQPSTRIGGLQKEPGSAPGNAAHHAAEDRQEPTQDREHRTIPSRPRAHDRTLPD